MAFNRPQTKSSRMSNNSDAEYLSGRVSSEFQSSQQKSLYQLFENIQENAEPSRKTEEKKKTIRESCQLKSKRGPEIEITEVLLPSEEPFENLEIGILRKEVEQMKAMVSTKIWQELNYISKEIKNMKGEYIQNFQSIAEQTNKVISNMQKESYSIKEELNKFKNCTNLFAKEMEEKIESLVLDNTKKGNNYELKNSIQGSSMSLNFGNENVNSKVLGQLLSQYEYVREKLEEQSSTQKELELKFQDSLLAKCPPIILKENISEEAISRLISDRLQIENRPYNIEARLINLEIKVKDIDKNFQNFEINFKTIQEDFQRAIHQEMAPRLSKIEGQSKVQQITHCASKCAKEVFLSQFANQLNKMKIIKVRDATNDESKILKILKANEDQISYKETYFLDEDNFLLDSHGTYLIEEVEGRKQKIKIEHQLVYLMQVNGINIVND